MYDLKASSLNWIKLAMCLYFAGFTNHSRGELVYRKVAVIDGKQASADPSESILQTESESPPVRITRIVEREGVSLLVLSGGLKQGVTPGAIMESRRLAQPEAGKPKTWITTAVLKVEHLRPDYALAKIQEEGSQDAALYFPESPRAMVGDSVVAQDLVISENLQIAPTITLTYSKLFTDPKSFPLNFELSQEGFELLKQEVQKLAGLRLQTLIVEAHTDTEGDRQSNQIESMQRANTVRQALIEELHLDPERVVAIGLGESEPIADQNLPGQKEKARRIVLRMSGQTP